MVEFITVFLISYIWHALGITIGYHRLLSHRSFSCPKFVEYFWVMGAYLAFEGSPIWWATVHRAHHKYSDTPLDPHSPKNGIYNAQIGWMLKEGYPANFSPEKNAKDLIKDPVYRFLEQGGVWKRNHQLALVLNLVVRAAIWVVFGWQAALASLLAGLIVLQVPLLLNVVCHIPKLGYRNYEHNDDSVNVWWVALLAMGEGWHNNHHASPGSARSGMRPWEIDVSWMTIKAMKWLGLVGRVNEATHESLVEKFKSNAIKARKEAMREKMTVRLGHAVRRKPAPVAVALRTYDRRARVRLRS